jgi:hypothetical protein
MTWEETHMIRTICLLVAAMSWWAAEAAGQSAIHAPARSFEELRATVASGDRVIVVDRSGEETRGLVASISDLAVTLTFDGEHRDFREEAVQRIDRERRDPVSNGLLIGGGAGAVLGFGVGRRLDSQPCRPGIECGQGAALGTMTGVMWGAAVGWVVDALHHKREVIYRRDQACAPAPCAPSTHAIRVD